MELELHSLMTLLHVDMTWTLTLPIQVDCLFVQLRTAAFKDYCAILVRRSNFRYQASPRVSPRESTQWWKIELWARNVR